MEINELLSCDVFQSQDKERASQILKAVEGMKIWEAKELLEKCIGALHFLKIFYKEGT